MLIILAAFSATSCLATPQREYEVRGYQIITPTSVIFCKGYTLIPFTQSSLQADSASAILPSNSLIGGEPCLNG
jgi:hypothetical protein